MERVLDPLALPSTVSEALAGAVRDHGDREALIGDGEVLTWSELDGVVDQVAAALIASGVASGDRIAIWAPNSPRWVELALGVYRAGGVVVPVNTRFKGTEVAHVLRNSGATMAFTVAEFLGEHPGEVMRSLAAPAVREVIDLDREGVAPSGWSDFIARGAAIAPGVVSDRAMTVGRHDISDLVFTSGTTGAPKGAMLTHGASIWAYETWTRIAGLAAGDRYLIINPFFHVFGLKAGILACVLTGAAMLPHAVFDVPTVIDRIESERITVLPGPPTLYQSILDHPARHGRDLGTLRLAVTGAATVPVEMVRRMSSELAFEVVLTGYGLTETCGIVSVCRPGDDPETIARTSGRPIPGVEIRIVDSAGGAVGVDEPGEVQVRGPNVTPGYFDDPEGSAASFADGWFATGDVGLVDHEGNVRITDRIKDMFIVGGFNAYPAEIEQVITMHPAVSQAAVVGAPDRRLGEVGVAYVVCRPDQPLVGEEVITWCRERLANYKVPRRVEVVDDLPLNASGKVLKTALRERASADLT